MRGECSCARTSIPGFKKGLHLEFTLISQIVFFFSCGNIFAVVVVVVVVVVVAVVDCNIRQFL